MHFGTFADFWCRNSIVTRAGNYCLVNAVLQRYNASLRIINTLAIPSPNSGHQHHFLHFFAEHSTNFLLNTHHFLNPFYVLSQQSLSSLTCLALTFRKQDYNAFQKNSPLPTHLAPTQRTELYCARPRYKHFFFLLFSTPRGAALGAPDGPQGLSPSLCRVSLYNLCMVYSPHFFYFIITLGEPPTNPTP